jgi:hypothetical protein
MSSWWRPLPACGYGRPPEVAGSPFASAWWARRPGSASPSLSRSRLHRHVDGLVAASSEATRRLEGPPGGRPRARHWGWAGPVPPTRAPLRTLCSRRQVVLSSSTLAVQTFSARSAKKALKRIGLLHRSRHRGRDRKLAAVVIPRQLTRRDPTAAPPGEKVLHGVETHQGGPRTFRAADGTDERAQPPRMAALCGVVEPEVRVHRLAPAPEPQLGLVHKPWQRVVTCRPTLKLPAAADAVVHRASVVRRNDASTTIMASDDR